MARLNETETIGRWLLITKTLLILAGLLQLFSIFAYHQHLLKASERKDIATNNNNAEYKCIERHNIDRTNVLINFGIIFGLFGLIGAICEKHYFVITTTLFNLAHLTRIFGQADDDDDDDAVDACLRQHQLILTGYLFLNVALVLASLGFIALLGWKRYRQRKAWIDQSREPPNYYKVMSNQHKYPLARLDSARDDHSGLDVHGEQAPPPPPSYSSVRLNITFNLGIV